MVPIPAQACNCVCHLFLRKPERGDLDVAILFKVVQTTKNTESDYFFIFFLFFFFKCSTKVIQHTDIPMASYTFYPISSYRFWLRDEENHLTEMATFLNNGFFIFLMG